MLDAPRFPLPAQRVPRFRCELANAEGVRQVVNVLGDPYCLNLGRLPVCYLDEVHGLPPPTPSKLWVRAFFEQLRVGDFVPRVDRSSQGSFGNGFARQAGTGRVLNVEDTLLKS